jgi:acyl-CoA synthetase (NDP forming)
LANLEKAYQESRARTYKRLTQATRARFGLVRRREVFKQQRVVVTAQLCAKRLLGEEPMLETYRTKKRMCASIPSKKIVQCAAVPSEEQAAAGLTQMQRSQLKMEPQWFQVCIS